MRRACALLLVIAVGPAPALPEAGTDVRSLASTLGFTESEIASRRGGRVVARILETRGADVAIAALLYVRADLPPLLEKPEEVRPFLTLGDPLQFGTFGDPPRREDIAALSFDPGELDDARGCRPRDCTLKLDQATMERLRWLKGRTPEAKAELGDLLRESMLESLLTYRRDGSLPVYVDRGKPVSVADGLRGVVADWVPDADSPFVRYVLDYPRVQLPDTRDAFYWSSEKLRKPIASVHHLVVHRTGEGVYAIADKHVSDNHFFRARLELLWLFPAADSSGFECVRLSLARIDPPAWFRDIVMGRVRRSARGSLVRRLEEARRRIESLTAASKEAAERLREGSRGGTPTSNSRSADRQTRFSSERSASRPERRGHLGRPRAGRGASGG